MTTLKDHLGAMVEGLAEHQEEDKDDQERLAKPCLDNTRRFLRRHGLNPDEPIEDLVTNLEATPQTDWSELERDKASSIVEVIRFAVTKEWRHYVDVTYAHNASHVQMLKLFRQDAFDHDMSRVTMQTLTTNTWWKRVPTECMRKSGFQLVEFHPTGGLARWTSHVSAGKKRKALEDVGNASGNANKRPKTETKEQKQETSWTQIYSQLVQNAQLACQTYILNQISHELVVLHRNMGSLVQTAPTVDSFVAKFLTPTTAATEVVPDPGRVPGPAGREPRQETKGSADQELWLPPSYGYLYELMDAYVDYCLAVSMVTFAADHQRYLDACDASLVCLAEAFSNETILSETLMAHRDIQTGLVKQGGVAQMMEEFDKGLYTARLESAIAARNRQVLNWIEHAADRAVQIRTTNQQQGINTLPSTQLIQQQWDGYMLAERTEAKAVFDERQHSKFAVLRTGYERHKDLVERFEKMRINLITQWRPHDIHPSCQQLQLAVQRIWRRPLPDSPNGREAQQRACNEWMAQLTKFVPTTRALDTALAKRHWQLPAELGECVVEICRQAGTWGEEETPPSWDVWTSWIKQATFLVVWYETLGVLLSTRVPTS